MTILTGPENADNFRVKVGRYGDRFYADPLPACDIAPASDATHPSFSHIKPPFGNAFFTMGLVAGMTDDEWQRLATLDRDGRYEALKANDKKRGRVNMNRGTVVHLWAEQILKGEPLADRTLLTAEYGKEAVDAAALYLPALQDWFDAYQPELVAAEVPCISRTLNGVGFGQTIDAFARINGDVWCIDHKSRTKHSVYLEESCQVAGPLLCDYMIVADGNGGAKRAPIPDLAGGLVVSLTVEGHRTYPIDVEAVRPTFTAMHGWWVAQRDHTASKAIGKAWAPRTAAPSTAAEPLLDAPATPPTSLSTIRDRVQVIKDAGHADTLIGLWPAGVPGLAADHAHTADELALILVAVRKTEDEHGYPWDLSDHPRVAPAAPPPEQSSPAARVDEGGTADAKAVDALRAKIQTLPGDQQAVIGAIAAEAGRAGTSVSLSQLPSIRRFEIGRALVALAAFGGDESFHRHLLAAVTNDDSVLQPTVTVGAAVGVLTIDEAKRLVELFDGLEAGRLIPTPTDGGWTITTADAA